MQLASIDFETRSLADLAEVGAHNYARHPSTCILTMAWELPDGHSGVWTPIDPFPEPLLKWILGGGLLAAWNAPFEREVWQEQYTRDPRFPRVYPEQWINTQAWAMAMNLPAKLEHAARALGTTEQKDTDGAKLMRRVTDANKPYPDAVELMRLKNYCMQDVRTERAIASRLRPLQPSEQSLYEVSERINMRGIPVDVPFARCAERAVLAYQHHCAVLMETRYNIKPTQVARLGEFCLHHGVKVDDLRADTIDALLDDRMAWSLPDPVRDALTLRRQASSASVKKYSALLRAVSPSGRLHGLLAFCGAGQTGRWSGRVLQPHNLPRPDMKFDEVRQAMLELQLAGGDWRALEPFSPGDPMRVLVNALRPTVGLPDRPVTACDLSAIEARVLAWLAGHEPSLEVFRENGDIYIVAASDIYHRPVTVEDTSERQIGKVATLALGFQGGKGAFQMMARGYGVSVTEDEAEEIKTAWRAARPEVVALWSALEAMALQAVAGPQFCYTLSGAVSEGHFLEVKERLALLGVRMTMYRGALAICLPSGRVLFYPNAKAEYAVALPLVKLFMEQGDTEQDARAKAHRWRVSYSTPGGAGMVRDGTYGGKLTENIVQAIARDIMAHGLRWADSWGLPVFLHVHDEIVAEGDCAEGLSQAMTTNLPKWAEGLPVHAKADVTERYWK